MSENRSRDFSEYASMETSELEEILRLDAQSPEGEESDMELILYIMEVLANRKGNSSENKKAAQEAYASFLENYYPQERKNAAAKAKPVLRVLKAASLILVLGLLFTLIPQKAQADSFWDWLTRQTAEFMEFFTSKDDEARIEEYNFQTENPGLQQVYDLAVEHGVTIPAVPMYLPGNYKIDECEFIHTPAKDYISAVFIDETKTVILNINIFESEVSHSYFKNATDILQTEIEGRPFHITKNNDVWIAVWSQDNIECSIAIDCQEDTLYRVLKSIYVMED